MRRAKSAPCWQCSYRVAGIQSIYVQRCDDRPDFMNALRLAGMSVAEPPSVARRNVCDTPNALDVVGIGGRKPPPPRRVA